MKRNAITNYSNVMSRAKELNILSNEELAASPLYSEYWMAAYELAKNLVSANYSLSQLVRELCCIDSDDLVMDLLCVLVKRYQTQIKSMLNPKTTENGEYHTHNHWNYTTCIFKRLLIDKLKPYEITEKKEFIDEGKKHKLTVAVVKKNEDGTNSKLYYRFSSLSTPISEDDDSLSLEDTLSLDIFPNPEKNVIDGENTRESKVKYYNSLSKLLSKKTYSPAYVYIEDLLCQLNMRNSLSNFLEIYNNFQAKTNTFKFQAKKAFCRAYNADLARLIKFLCNEGISCDEGNLLLERYSADDYDKDFGLLLTPDRLYHTRSSNKKFLRETERK